MLDAIIIILLIGAMASGYKKGALSVLESMIAIIIGVLVAYCFTPIISNAFQQCLTHYIPIAGRSFVSISLYFIVYRIARTLTKNFLQLGNLPKPFSTINSCLGIGVGLLKVLLIIWLIVSLLQLTPVAPIKNQLYQSSNLLHQIAMHNPLDNFSYLSWLRIDNHARL